MRAVVEPGSTVRGASTAPGDKSIAHRWLILAVTARGRSLLTGIPGSLDVRSTASCLAGIASKARPALDALTPNDGPTVERLGSTWNRKGERGQGPSVEVEGEGRDGLTAPSSRLDCGNSGTSMRLIAGLLAAAPFEAVLDGDASLRTRPMERVAEPLRRMGAHVDTDEGHAPVVVRGASLRGIVHEAATPSAQVKGAVLLAGIAADGTTTVREPAPTRDHTERALAALGGPIEVDGDRIEVSRFQHEGFSAVVPGDPSSAGFPIAAAVLTGGSLRVEGVGVNPTRLGYLEVLGRMGVRTLVEVRGEELGEPVGAIEVDAGGALRGTTVAADELPRVIDEVPLLAVVAAHAEGETRFRGVGELRVKESDRVGALVAGLRGLGGDAVDEGDDLVVGGGGAGGGRPPPPTTTASRWPSWWPPSRRGVPRPSRGWSPPR